ncbi:structural protein [Polaribacter phage Danklef_1]|uniref:Structural protein n=1 Tax=Polaribacter phage Danklef_1 TaxID=2745646 RepID=A0A8E5E8U3_9CAUD|nr:structural protein [Polaribacter phage Danklef_1]QQV90490.1 structural protein [Polaribacter phage Danklef_1]QQV90567.1 structural protein [Polaribacter phage Danklef_2]
MATLVSQLARAQKLTPNKLEKDIFNFIKSIENKFFDANIKRLERGEDAKGGLLTNKDRRFSGLYTQTTEDISRLENPLAPKRAGDPYNFLYTGDFVRGFQMFQKTGRVEIFSTGTGSGDKAAFFSGYDGLHDTSDEDLKRIIKEDILPHLQNNVIRKGLGI